MMASVKRLRLKIPPPVVALLFALMIWGLSRYLPQHDLATPIRHGIALLLLAIALCIDIWALISFRRAKTTIDPRYPDRTSTIVTSGIYSYTRNPMYLGLAFMLSAWSLWLAAKFGLFLVAAFILYITKFQIRPEEKALKKQFGESYLRYKASVRRWI